MNALIQSTRVILLSSLLVACSLRAQQADDSTRSFFVSATGGISSLALSGDIYRLEFSNYQKYQLWPLHYGASHPAIARIEGLFHARSLISDYLSIGLHFEDFNIRLPYMNPAYVHAKPGDTVVDVLESKILLQYIGMSVGIKYDLSSSESPSGFALQLSLSGGINLKSQQRSTLHLDYYYGKFSEEKNEQLEAPWYRLSLRPELLYDIPLGAQFFITPRVGADFSLTEIEPTRARSIAMTFAALSLAYAIR